MKHQDAENVAARKALEEVRKAGSTCYGLETLHRCGGGGCDAAIGGDRLSITSQADPTDSYRLTPRLRAGCPGRQPHPSRPRSCMFGAVDPMGMKGAVGFARVG